MSEREKDIQKLCRQILEASPNVYCNPNGPDESTCPICNEIFPMMEYEISKINHRKDCGYLIAKDLSTNHLNGKA